MFFFELPAILVAVYGWNFRILQTSNAYQKSTQQGKLVRISLKFDEKFNRGISYSGQIVFFQFLHYTCFSSAICPLQVPGLNIAVASILDMNSGMQFCHSVHLIHHFSVWLAHLH